ncbi:zinc ribbon domain-containing protein [Curtobacterium flaccumfaciens]|uniref:zinc ribbon domain-containing protein n=1 Tax=Curtobacterium flaccumfaciens TaxID=2035 RepID=UPI00160335A6|nr:zinc ribbon domain-containing protein [Curtobacterium flaccumfaciens]MBB1198643.1 zinc ribbon domain-containing protein [Curtobacterium flaccumfaciens]
MMRKTPDETITCEHCGSQIPADAVFCGECGRVVDPAHAPEDAPAVQELMRRAFAERELTAAAAVVEHETREEAAARQQREYHASLRWLHLASIQSSLAAVLGLHDDDPGILALHWSVSSTNRFVDRGKPAAPVLFFTHINGVRIEAAVDAGKVTFTGVSHPSRRVPITSLATLASAIDPR